MKDNRFKSPPDYAISGEITDKDDKSSNKEDCLAEASELPKLNQYVYYLDVLGFNTWDLKQINELRVSSRSSPSLLPKVAKLLGCIIQNSPTLKKLDIRDFNMNREDILEIFNRDGIYICALEEIIFPTHSHDLGIYDFQLMLSFVKSIKSVKTLILRDCGLDDTIIGSLIVTLENTQISELDVQGNQFSHNGLTALLISKDLNSLKSLKISCKSKEDIELVSRYLCREGLKLECIELQFSTECSKCTNPTRIVESIPNSSQLKRLDMFGLDSCFASHNKKHVTLFQTKVCNLSTFQDLCRSNHQLQRIQCFDLEAAIYRSDNLAKALMINMERMSLSDKIRCKLFTFYFDGDFSVLPFLEMELKTIPYILTILGNPMKKCEFVSYDPYDSRPAIAVSADHLETMYQFIRKWNLPTLFEH